MDIVGIEPPPPEVPGTVPSPCSGTATVSPLPSCTCITPSVEELCAQIAQIDAAIAQLMLGKRLLQVTVGSHMFSRTWKFADVNVANLRAYRAELADLLRSLRGCAPTFRMNATIPLIVQSFGV